MPQNLPIETESLQTRSRSEMIEITERVQRLVGEQKVEEGLVIVYVPHTTPCVALLPPEAKRL